MALKAPRTNEETTEAAALVQAYESALRSYFARRIRSASEVDDLVQESFARMLSARPANAVQSPIAYLFRIASNLLVDRARAHGKAGGPLVPIGDDEPHSAPPTQEDALRHDDLRTAYVEALDDLPPQCRRVFVLRRHEELGTTDIAVRLGITPRMVQKHFALALAHLHRRLRHFVDED